MNRSILIVICDFLLLSLLTFSTDINRMADEDTAPPTRVVIATNEAPAAGQDLVDVMKRALEEQRHGQEQLEQQLAAAKLAANEQQAQMDRRQQENRQLQQYYATAQTNLENLNQQMQDAAARSRTLQQQLATTQAQAQQQSELAAALRLQLEQFARTNQMAQAEKQQLAHQLQLAEVRAQSAAQQAALMQQEVQAERAENVKLAEGFKTLATNSSRLTEEIRSSTPLAPNTIFSEFVSNQIAANIVASRSGLLGRNVTDSKSSGDEHGGEAGGIEPRGFRPEKQQGAGDEDQVSECGQRLSPAAVGASRESEHGEAADDHHRQEQLIVLRHLQMVLARDDEREIEEEGGHEEVHEEAATGKRQHRTVGENLVNLNISPEGQA